MFTTTDSAVRCRRTCSTCSFPSWLTIISWSQAAHGDDALKRGRGSCHAAMPWASSWPRGMEPGELREQLHVRASVCRLRRWRTWSRATAGRIPVPNMNGTPPPPPNGPRQPGDPPPPEDPPAARRRTSADRTRLFWRQLRRETLARSQREILREIRREVLGNSLGHSFGGSLGSPSADPWGIPSADPWEVLRRILREFLRRILGEFLRRILGELLRRLLRSSFGSSLVPACRTASPSRGAAKPSSVACMRVTCPAVNITIATSST